MSGKAILRTIRGLACLAVLLGVAGAARPQGVQTARKQLRKLLVDQGDGVLALVGLRSTEDQDLRPLFAAVARTGDEQSRMVAISGLVRLKGPQALAVLRERVRKDDSEAVGIQALGELLEMDAADTELLRGVLSGRLPGVRLLAARHLVRRGEGASARAVLVEFAGSKVDEAVVMARMCLLAMGDKDQRPPLAKRLRDPDTPDKILAILCGQAAEDKIPAALSLVAPLAESTARRAEVRLVAYRAVAALDPRGAGKLAAAIGKSTRTNFRLDLLRILLKKGAGSELPALAKEEGLVGAIARFELARPKGGRAATRAAAAAVGHGHVVGVIHVLNRAKEDIAARGGKAAFYAPVLMDVLRGASRAQREPTAGRAATLLGNLGTPEALAALKRVLAGPRGQARSAAVAGLLVTTNRAAALLAKPLLTSPYAELSTTAALALGRFGERAAGQRLAEILENPQRHPPQIVAMAGWYLLKIHGMGGVFVKDYLKLAR